MGERPARMRPGRAGLIAAGLCIAVLSLATSSHASGALAGAAIGLAVGGVYVAMLLYGLRRVPRLGGSAAVRAMQIGGVTRLAFVVAALSLASRLDPAANLAWAAGTALLPLAGSLIHAGRQGVRL